MLIKNNWLLLCLVLLPLSGFSQKLKKDDNHPKLTFWAVVGDSLTPLKHLTKDKENRIQIKVEGGIDNVKHEITVTSKDASIRSDPQGKNQELVMPIHEKPCEIIVDIETFENYYGVQTLHREGKKPKQVVKTFPPKRYMLGYERFEVK